MKQKIEWYKEVLELEPGSRIFFPLAKLLAAEGQIADAALTLRQGLGRHPDHVEARLMLVELLSRQSSEGEVQREINDLSSLFSSYPGFWQAWSDHLAADPAMHDASVALRYFSAAMQGQHIDWAAVIELGLKAVLEGESQPPFPVSSQTSPRDEADDEDLGIPAVPEIGIAEALSTPYQEKSPLSVTLASSRGLSAQEGDVEAESGEGKTEKAAAESLEDVSDEDDQEEAFSLRTRSMAEVLADQGDYASAAEIYQELLQAAPDGEKAALEARLEELTAKLGTLPATESDKSDDKKQSPAVESTRLVGLLESLAERLEDRTR